MTIYYQDEHVTLYHGDCLTERREWLDADVLVTDPPYGMNYQSNFRKGERLALVAADQDTKVRDAAVEAWGGVRPMLMFGTWRVAPPAGERARLIWSKGATPGMGDLSIPWGTSHEDIHLGGTGWDLASTGHNREPSVITARSTASGASGDATKYGHPTPKPVALMEYLIERCPAGVIADPFAGSGATLVAARNLGRKVIGVELEERYCEIIAKRLAQGAFDFGGIA